MSEAEKRTRSLWDQLVNPVDIKERTEIIMKSRGLTRGKARMQAEMDNNFARLVVIVQLILGLGTAGVLASQFPAFVSHFWANR